MGAGEKVNGGDFGNLILTIPTERERFGAAPTRWSLHFLFHLYLGK